MERAMTATKSNWMCNYVHSIAENAFLEMMYEIETMATLFTTLRIIASIINFDTTS